MGSLKYQKYLRILYKSWTEIIQSVRKGSFYVLFSPFTYLPGFLVRLFLCEPDLFLGHEKGIILLWGTGAWKTITWKYTIFCKSFREEIHPLQVYLAWQVQSSTLLRCELGRTTNYPVLLSKKAKYWFCHSPNWIYITYLACFHTEPFLRQHFSGNDQGQEKTVERAVLCWSWQV